MSSSAERQIRSGETTVHPFRSDRFYHADNNWYFLIRGGASRGPYESRDDAAAGLNEYIETQMRLNQIFHQAKDSPH